MDHRLRGTLSTLVSLPVIADAGSIRRAAELLSVSQPALTRKLSRLEEILGTKLVTRTAKGVVLTSFGEMVAASARVIETELLCTFRAAEELKANPSGSIRVGVPAPMPPHIITPAIESLQSEFPKLSVKIIGLGRADQRLKLLNGDVDLVVSSHPFGQPDDHFAEHTLYDFNLHVIAKAGHELTLGKNLTLKDIVGFQWILPSKSSGLYKRIRDTFRRAGYEMPSTSMEIIRSAESTKALLASSNMLAILAAEAIEEDLASGKLVMLSGDWDFGHHTIAAFMRERSMRLPVVTALLKHLKRPGGTTEKAKRTSRSAGKRSSPTHTSFA